jgi:5'-deoxynucleotidase YfbR-like HD superfamily hydrolase
METVKIDMVANPQLIEPWIESFTGKKVYFLNPKPDMFDIEDIAHALSMIVRYTGHVKKFYSVAEHSVAVSRLTGNLEGLMHDGSEAYLIDVASPIKQHLRGYKEMESGIMVVLAEKFGFNWPLSRDTKDADATQLKTEARHLLPSGGKDWLGHFPTKRSRGIVPECWSPKQAKREFLNRFAELSK